MLTRDKGEFTIREILDNAFSNKEAKLYSLVGVFENQISMMEKQLKMEGAVNSDIISVTNSDKNSEVFRNTQSIKA
jgi:hypothetical protein